MNMVSVADASYVEHPDGKSHKGGVVGFESETCCHFGFVSSKQLVTAKSAGEAELIAQIKVGDVEWEREMLEELGYLQKILTEDSAYVSGQYMCHANGEAKNMLFYESPLNFSASFAFFLFFFQDTGRKPTTALTGYALSHDTVFFST
jgi:hypothetical protein